MVPTQQFYINGVWVDPATPNAFAVINPATEKELGNISLGSKEDVNKAVAAAKRAFETWGQSRREERLELLQKLAEIYERRIDEMAVAISLEMGAPLDLATNAQAASGLAHIRTFIKELEVFEFEHPLREGDEKYQILREPIGVCALITPWNWPMNQVTLKAGAALAAGCTMILKPSEIAPLSALLFAEFVDETGFPAGVFNLVNGDGPVVGSALSGHPDVDMVSFTGSTRAGILVSKNAADTVKRVALELGGKSPNIIFADADVARSVKEGQCIVSTIPDSPVMRLPACWSKPLSMTKQWKLPKRWLQKLRSGSHQTKAVILDRLCLKLILAKCRHSFKKV